jgi:hypothetical protein
MYVLNEKSAAIIMFIIITYIIMYDLYSNNKRWNLRLNNDLVLLTFEV